jgi:hypothetical protein
MAYKSQGMTPGMRIKLGASVLAAARAVDTKLVEARLTAFERAHRGYVSAQRRVGTAESHLRAAQVWLAACDRLQDDAVETVARALVADGKPRGNPFEELGVPAPGTLKQLPIAEEAQAVHALVAGVLRLTEASAATREAANEADTAARTAEEALAPMAKLQDDVRDARRMRDALARDWDAALAALRRGCRSAADEGAPHLYGALFPPAVRGAAKKPVEEPPKAAQTSPA